MCAFKAKKERNEFFDERDEIKIWITLKCFVTNMVELFGDL